MHYLILSFSIINLLLGVVVLIQTKKEIKNITFLFFSGFASLWTFNNFYLRLNPQVEFLRLSYGLGVLVAFLCLVWVYLFLRDKLSVLIKYIVRTTIPRTDADKRLVVERALKHKEAAQLSLRGVAVHCGVPIEFVEQVKKGTNNKNEKTTSVPKRVVLSDVRKRTIASPKRSVITNSTAAPKSQSVRTSTRVIKISNREEIGRVISDLHALYGKVSKDEREEVLHFVRVFLAMNERKARVNQ
jgi:hypothetical protein